MTKHDERAKKRPKKSFTFWMLGNKKGRLIPLYDRWLFDTKAEVARHFIAGNRRGEVPIKVRVTIVTEGRKNGRGS